ncbi:MAG: N-acetylmuramoyl-L-alanine amidase [Mucilaginibacter polytrichastri]|nr:N-acetylmuramoyl-L-alanine amidase [Mucilaginibacter polytrichastri]
MFTYLAQVTICTAAFFALYRLVFYRFSFYRFNRFYLLLTFLSSFAIPLLSLRVEQKMPAEVQHVKIPVKTQAVELHEHFAEHADGKRIDRSRAAELVYAGIGTCFLAVFVYNLVSLLILCGGKGVRHGGMILVEKENSPVNFSFFRYIFISEKGTAQPGFALFFAHEKFHATQYHSADRLLFSLGKVLLWFNPFVYLYSREMALQHEYEADAHVSGRFGKTHYARALLDAATLQPGFSGLPVAFAREPVKSRIRRIFTPNTLDMKKSLYVLALPLFALLGWNYSVKKVYTSNIAAEKFTVVLDAGHGGNDTGAGIHGLYEKDLTLALAKAISAKLQSADIEVVMTRNGDQLVPLADRVKRKGDFFLSIHANYQAGATEKKGVSMLLPRWEGETPASVRATRSAAMSGYLADAFRSGTQLDIDEKNYHDQHLYVLEKSASPALLLEVGFMTNASDLEYISSMKGREDVALALTSAVIKYRDTQP